MICADCKWIKKCSYPPDTAYYCRRYDMYVHEQTNEEWFATLSTEEKATFLASNKMLNFDYQMWIEWLREIHK